MNPWLKSTLVIILGVIILATGSGVSLAKMVCLKSGYTQITLTETDDCCKHDHKTNVVTIEQKCCDISSMNVEALHYLVSSQQSIQKDFPQLVFSSPLSMWNSVSIARNSIETLSQDVAFNADSPPIRILTKSFLI